MDDEADTVEALALLLGLDGRIVRTATSATLALTLLEIFAPDVAFVDVNMPEISGFGHVDQMRHQAARRQVKLVALTSDASQLDREAALSGGFDFHLAKLLDMEVPASILASVHPRVP